jgi:hypothetical protein
VRFNSCIFFGKNQLSGVVRLNIFFAGMTNVFKIRHGKETHVYRTENASDKKSLLSQFRQVAEELAAKKRKEREGEHERRKSLWAGGDVSLYIFIFVDVDLMHLDKAHIIPRQGLNDTRLDG